MYAFTLALMLRVRLLVFLCALVSQNIVPTLIRACIQPAPAGECAPYLESHNIESKTQDPVHPHKNKKQDENPDTPNTAEHSS